MIVFGLGLSARLVSRRIVAPLRNPLRVGFSRDFITTTPSSFKHTLAAQLLFKSKAEVKKPKAVQVNSEQSIPLKDDIIDLSEDKEAKLLKNKYYRRMPRILKPYMRSFMLRPIGFGVSFAVLHEITAIIPFLGFWWFFMYINWMPFHLPAEVVHKGIDMINSALANKDIGGLVDKAQLVMAGANAYALTKVFLPIRIPICFVLAPWFDRWVIQPITNLFSSKKKSKTSSKEIWDTPLEEAKTKSVDQKRI
ncbi:unnamed protein product [Kuraishia capsulata CBS 1993]|uniref:Uncharacterized protein n=1 Tax=Kuraishia capsulata CBS 1993 TaxID=1382522 RepID=W6MRQ8_9ASCO|nr:uncharacterized protein KUCA_T00005444001 [Kuraishia capsulata CBS 1993]CDK29456.1 unnamed protein product [Kuraishia capsulata CBS 1993]